MLKHLRFFPLCLLLVPAAPAREVIRLASSPSLSPDGATLAFEWNGDVWTVPTAGGEARPLTQHPGRDGEPRFSPDGKEIAFIGDREGGRQVYVVPAAGGTPKQLTYHSAGYALQEWMPDGKSLLVQASRDHGWRHADRFFTIACSERPAEQLLFDDYGNSGTLSPDGKRLLFTREGEPWWRKGYKGSQASQVWMYDLDRKSFAKILAGEHGCRWPMWRADGKGFYYVSAESGYSNLWEYDLELKRKKELTKLTGELIVFPCISRDGTVIVFRQLFDLYRFNPGAKESPRKIDISHNGDRVTTRKERRTLQTASQVAFSGDGLEVAFTAGGDVWVMDTELREPKQITTTAEDERDPVFAPDGESILFISDSGGKSDIWKAERADTQKFWWQNAKFKLQRITQIGDISGGLRFSPDGTRIAYRRGRGDIWTADTDGKNAKRVVQSWSTPDFDLSPDGKWIVYAQNDNDFNRDVWLLPLDSSAKPLNLSRHPNNESHPVWSPDGRVIAYSGQRASTGSDAAISLVWLRTEDAEKDAQDRALEKAIDKINKVRKPGPRRPFPSGDGAADAPSKKPTPVVIDMEGLHDRIRRIRLGENASVSELFWSPDGKKLAFTGSMDGKAGVYTIDIYEELTPKQLASATGTQARWLRQGNQIVWLSAGVPASLPGTASAAPTTGTTGGLTSRLPPSLRGRVTAPSSGDSPTPGTSYRFSAVQEVDLPKKHAAAFELCWRTMRDNWYDERLGNKDWEAVRKKYLDGASQSPDTESFATVVHLMLGELNGSHLGFMPRPSTSGLALRRRGMPTDPPSPEATGAPVTVHLGVRFDPDHEGPGLKVKDV
ncbi:MAG TPA: hypothetical protein VKD72_09935, partial [Gemmataceae bacterium]|nr:hypothetical protein [Gemmataceae bacterium]